MDRRILGVFVAAILVLSISVGASFAANSGGASADHRQDGAHKQLEKGNPHQFKQLKLMYTTTDPAGEDPAVWAHVPGNEVSGFKLCLNDTYEYYYLDVMALKSEAQIADGEYAFILDTGSIADWEAWEEYWTGRGVDVTGESNDGYLGTLYQIFIEGTLPVFYLDVDSGSYMLLDGFQYALGDMDQALRVDGDYFLGSFTYKGDVAFEDASTEIAIQITFKACECEECLQE